MENFIPLNQSQENALIAMYEHWGYQLCMSDVLVYMEKELGKFNKHTVNLRLILNKNVGELMEKKSKTLEESNLQDVFWERYELNEKK